MGVVPTKYRAEKEKRSILCPGSGVPKTGELAHSSWNGEVQFDVKGEWHRRGEQGARAS